MNTSTRWIFVVAATVFMCSLAPASEAGTIQGTVTTTGGVPLANVDVAADAGAGFYVDVTDGSGVFSITAPAGSYHVLATEGPYAVSHYWGVDVTTSGSTTVDFTLRPGGGSMSGTVVDGTGAPVAGATVHGWQRVDGSFDNAAYGTTVTDEDGEFTLRDPEPVYGLATGQYRLNNSKSGLPLGVKDNVSVVAGEETSDVTITMVTGTAALLGNVTTSAGEGISGAAVFIEGPTASALGLTDESGSYGFGSLPAGSYHTVVSAEGYAGAHRSGVEVGDGQIVAGVDFVLGRDPGSVSGRVTATSDGSPIVGASIFADSDEGDGWGSATADTNGDYVLSGLAPMTYVVHVVKPGFAGQARQVSVASSAETEDIDFELGEANAAIAGQVTAGGSPVAGAALYVNSSAGATTVVDTSCVADSNGEYTCGNLSAGSYDVHVSGAIGYTNQVLFEVVVADGSTTSGTDFEMVNGEATIRGTVRDPDGAPLAEAKVQTFLEQSPGTWAVTYTDTEGQYQVDGLWGGDYLVTASLAGFAMLSRNHVPVSDSGETVVNLPDDSGSEEGRCAALAYPTERTASLLKARIVAGSDGRLLMKGRIPDIGLDLSSDSLLVALFEDDEMAVCATLVRTGGRAGRVFLYNDPSASENGLTRVRLKSRASGKVKFLIRGKGVTRGTADAPTIRFGFSIGDDSVGGSATLRRQGPKFVWP